MRIFPYKETKEVTVLVGVDIEIHNGGAHFHIAREGYFFLNFKWTRGSFKFSLNLCFSV